jgi:hypothetical protein
MPIYRPEPTARRFHGSRADVRGLMGPIGSGKSVACVNEIMRLGMLQKPQIDGVRRMRTAIVRNTYPELKSTTINTFKDWAPIEYTTWKMDSPIMARIRTDSIDWEVYFIAVDRPDDVKKLLSLELTNGWINEARELPWEVVKGVNSRIGRYPSKANGGPVQPCLIMDTNPCDDDHWWFRKFEVEKPDGFALFKQPPALVKDNFGNWNPNPTAENIKNLALGYTYYIRMLAGNDDQWLNVYVCGQYGSVADGKPVFPEYKDFIHCASEDLTVLKGLPLYIGFDYGRTPAAIFGQFTPQGQFRIIDELVVETEGPGMGIRTFMREVVMPHVANHYHGMTVIARGDPAGVAKDGNELSCFDIQGEEGMLVEPASTNDIVPRLDALSRHMKTTVDGEPGFLLSPKCKMIRKGLLGGYKFVRVKVTGEERYKDTPDKNKYSHPLDAAQYLGLAINEVQNFTQSYARPIQKARRGAIL